MEKSSALAQPLNFDNYTFRCSSVGKLMGNPKGGTPFQIYNKALIEFDELKSTSESGKLTKAQQKKYDDLKIKLPELEKTKDDVVLSETAISYLIEVYSTVRYKIMREITGKYLDSGKARENESIKLIAEVDDELYEKCILPRMRNDFIEGECDILYPLHAPEIVIDAKSCWDCFTFEPHFLDDDLENKIYDWQGIGYSELYGVSRFKLCYTLVDMPDEIVEDELKRILYKFGTSKKDSQEYLDACEEFISKTKYSHLPANERVISFTFEYNDEKRKEYLRLTRYIIAARKWLNNYAIMRWEKTNKKRWEGKRDEDVNTESEVKFVALEEVKKEDLNFSGGVFSVPNQVVEVNISRKCPQCDSTDLLFREGGVEDFECNDCGYDNIIDGKKGKDAVEQVLSGESNEVVINPEHENKIEKIEKKIFEQIKKCKSIDKLEAYLKHLLDNKVIEETPEYMSIYNEFSNHDKDIRSVSRKWYYIAETNEFYLFSKDEYNALDENSTFFQLLGFICDASSYKTEEAKKILDEKISENVGDVFNNVVKLPSEPENITVQSSFDEKPVVKIEDAVPEPIKSEEVSDPILKEIDALDSKDACLDYYTEKGVDYWTDNPQYYSALDKKKKSFIVSKPVEQPKSNPSPISKPSDKPQEPQTAKTLKPTLSALVTDSPQPGDEEIIEGFKKLYPTFTTVQQYRDLYVSNRAVIDRNQKFRDELNLAGQMFAKEQVEQAKKKIEEEMRGN